MSKLHVLGALALLAVGCGAAEEARIQKQTAGLFEDVCAIMFNERAVPEALARAVIESTGATLNHYMDGTGIGLVDGCSKLFGGAGLDASISTVVPIANYGLSPVSAVQPGPTLSGPTATDFLYDWLQWDIRRVRADKAWQKTSGSHSTVVAVIDTGVAFNHPDLAPNKVDDQCFDMASLVYGVPCSPYPRYHWHGTHVAGTIAAAFDGGFAVGVGPNLGIANYNVSEPPDPDGNVGLSFYSVFASLWDAANKGYVAANLSLGAFLDKPVGYYAPELLTLGNRVVSYCKQKGLSVVAAAGNDATSLNGPTAMFPADAEGVISVGATGIGPAAAYPQPGFFDTLAFYSNYGAAVTLGAPGGDCGPGGEAACGDPTTSWYEHLVLSTYVEADPICAATQSCAVDYVWAAGTSMATPHVVGAVGLLRDASPKLTPNQVAAILKKTAAPLGSQLVFGHGLLDVAAALGVK